MAKVKPLPTEKELLERALEIIQDAPPSDARNRWLDDMRKRKNQHAKEMQALALWEG